MNFEHVYELLMKTLGDKWSAADVSYASLESFVFL